MAKAKRYYPLISTVENPLPHVESRSISNAKFSMSNYYSYAFLEVFLKNWHGTTGATFGIWCKRFGFRVSSPHPTVENPTDNLPNLNLFCPASLISMVENPLPHVESRSISNAKFSMSNYYSYAFLEVFLKNWHETTGATFGIWCKRFGFGFPVSAPHPTVENLTPQKQSSQKQPIP